MVDQSGTKQKSPKDLPRYQQVAAVLIDDIESGRSPVGSLLKTEYELCEQFGVSRYTVREALRILFEAGLVSRRRGAGTVVIATKRPPIFNHAMDSISDILDYSRETRVDFSDASRGPLSQRLKEAFPENGKRNWISVRGLRFKDNDPRPVCINNIYLDDRLTGIEEKLTVGDRPIISIVEQDFGVRAIRLEQTIHAMALQDDEAKILRADAGGPALCLVRQFIDEAGRVVQITESIYPASRITISSSFDRGDFNFQ